MPTPIPTKHCPDCEQDLPLTEFHKNRNTKDKHAVYCRRCHSIRRYGPVELRVQRPHLSTVRVQERIAADRKLCARCGLEKILSEDFHINRHAADGHSCYCKPCHIQAVLSTIDPERVQQYAERYRFLNRDKLLAYAVSRRQKQKANPPGTPRGP